MVTTPRAAVFFAVFLILLPLAAFADEAYSEVRPLLGTYVSIKIQDTDKSTAQKRGIAEKAFREIERVENLLSNFKNDNIIYAINHSGTAEIPLDEETLYVLQRAKYFNGISKGAFDITVLPLLELWGFHSKEYAVPTDDAIKNALTKIGSDKIILDAQKKTVRFSEPGMEIDLGGIAAGYAVDKAVEVLRANGVAGAIVDAGGDIYCLGGREKNRGWVVGIRDPIAKSGIAGKIEIRDKAVTTSGGYENFFKADGKVYSHIIDPRTGRPAQNTLLSATVIAGDCITADALATAVIALGENESRSMINALDGVQVVIISRGRWGIKKETLGPKKEKKQK